MSYALRIPPKEVRKRIEAGETAIRNVLLLTNILTRIRDNHKHPHHCPKCEVQRTVAGECLNPVQCSLRSNFADTVMATSPFNIPELHITRKDVMLLLHHRNQIGTAVRQLGGKTGPISVAGLFGVTEKQWASLSQIKTLV